MKEQLNEAQSILRRKQVEHAVGLSRSQLYALQKIGKFPQSISLSARAVGWLSSDIQAWIAERAAASRAPSI
ncbi:MAG: AlpA family phage regulatory protein [Rhodocyclaceae bacterium]|nr:AlpA family phage regulatory protein [Rhodocyclaceae bacterium]